MHSEEFSILHVVHPPGAHRAQGLLLVEAQPLEVHQHVADVPGLVLAAGRAPAGGRVPVLRRFANGAGALASERLRRHDLLAKGKHDCDG